MTSAWNEHMVVDEIEQYLSSWPAKLMTGVDMEVLSKICARSAEDQEEAARKKIKLQELQSLQEDLKTL